MAPARRLVRRQPLKDRILAMLNPMDLLLWLSEEIETREWNSKALGTRSGIIASVMFLLARANTGGASQDIDDVFGEDGGTGWVPFIVSHPRAMLPLPRPELTWSRPRLILRCGHLWLYHLPMPSTPLRECATTDCSRPTSSGCQRHLRPGESRCSRSRRPRHPCGSCPTLCRQRRRSREHTRTRRTMFGNSPCGIHCRPASGSSASSALVMFSSICSFYRLRPSTSARA